MTLREELEVAFTRVYFAPRKERIAKEMADAAVEVLRGAGPKAIKELLA